MFDFCVDKGIYVRYNPIYKQMFVTDVRLFEKEMVQVMRRDNHRKENKVIIRARLRRRNERYIRLFRFCVVMLTVMTVSTVMLSLRSFALAEDKKEPSYKCYTSYTVQSGDTLRKIAADHITDEYSSADRYISEVVSINHLISASEIDAGQTIILPYYTTVKQ